MIKRLLFSALIISFLLGLTSHAAFADETSDAGQKAAQWLLTQRDSQGSMSGVGFSGWALMGLKANGQTSSSTLNYLANNLTGLNTTDLERTILAVIAGGGDPYHFGGHDLVAELKAQAKDHQLGSASTINDDTFGVLALLASGEPITDPTVTDSIHYILQSQQADGSFSWQTTGAGDSNDTAIAIEALRLAEAKGYNGSVNYDKAINYLQTTQNSDGGFGFENGETSDAASTSWVVNAIIALGQQPEAWSRDGHNPYAYLLSLQTAEGGIKSQSAADNADVRTTAFAAIAFAHKTLPVAVIAPTAVPTPEATPTPVFTPSPTPISTAIPTPSPTTEPSVVPSPSNTPAASPSPLPTPIPSPTPQVASPSPAATASPAAPTPTPTPSATTTFAERAAQPSPSPTVSPTASPTVLVISNRALAADPGFQLDSAENIIVEDQPTSNPKPNVLSTIKQLFTKQAAPTTLQVTPISSPSPSPTPSLTNPTASPIASLTPLQSTNIDVSPLPVEDAKVDIKSYILEALLAFIGIFLIGWGVARILIHRHLVAPEPTKLTDHTT